MEFVRLPEGLKSRTIKIQSAAASSSSGSSAGHTTQVLTTTGQVARKATLIHPKEKTVKPSSPIRRRAPSPSVSGNIIDSTLTKEATKVIDTFLPVDPGIRCSPPVVHFAGFTVAGTGTSNADSAISSSSSSSSPLSATALSSPGEVALVHVRNISTEAQRVYVSPIDPTKDDGRYFSIDVQNAGRIAAGMNQDFRIRFFPQELRYYYTSVRIVSEMGEVTIPIHAYPVANKFTFPERIDFGRIPLYDTITKSLTLSSGVPIPFMFRLDVTKPHADIHIEPLEATIPPNSTVDVHITYTPSSLTTALSELFIHTSQHNWKPLKVTIAGSSHPGSRRDNAVAAALQQNNRFKATGPAAIGILTDAPFSSSSLSPEQTSSLSPHRYDGNDATNERKENKQDDGYYPSSTQQTTKSIAASHRGVGMKRWIEKDGGLILLDDKLEKFKIAREKELIQSLETRSMIVDQLAAAMHVATGAEVSRTEAIELVKQVTGNRQAAVDDYTPEGDGLGEFTLVGNIRIPPTIKNQNDVNFILNQKDGKLLPRDIKRAVKAKRLQAAATQAAQSRMRSLADRKDEDGDEYTSDLPFQTAPARKGRSLDGTYDSPGGLTLNMGSPTSRGSSPSPGRGYHSSSSSSSTSPHRKHRSNRSSSRGHGGSPTTANRTLGSDKILTRQSAMDGNTIDPAIAAATKRSQNRQRVQAGPGLGSSALASSSLASSWLFPALQGVRTTDLPRVLIQLVSTPDSTYVDTHTQIDELLGSAGAVILGSHILNVYTSRDFVSGLPPALAALVNASSSPLLDPRLLRESVFIQETNDIAKAEMAREFSQVPWNGERLVTAATVSRVRRLRALLIALQDIVQRRLLRTRRTTLAIPSGGLAAMAQLQAAITAAAVAQAGKEAEEAGEAALDAMKVAGNRTAKNPILASPVVRAALLPLSRPIIPFGVPVVRSPTFLDTSIDNGLWSTRSDAFKRFRHAVTTHIVRARVDQRLSLLLNKLAAAAAVSNFDFRSLTSLQGTHGKGNNKSTIHQEQQQEAALVATRAAVADLVDREHRRAQIENRATWIIDRPSKTDLAVVAAKTQHGGDQRSEEGKLRFHISAARVVPVTFPIPPVDDAAADSSASTATGWDLTQPLASGIPSWFCEHTYFDEPEWPEELEMGYTPFGIPSAPICQPLEDTRPLRDGALHETAATGLLPLPCGQSALDPRLAIAVTSNKQYSLSIAGLNVGSETFNLRHVWSEMGVSHPSYRTLPLSAPHTGDPSTTLTEAGVTECDPSYLLHPFVALTEGMYSSSYPSMPPQVLGLQHAHATGMGIGTPRHPLPGILNTGLSAGGNINTNPVPYNPAFHSPLDTNGTLPTAGQVYSSQMGFSSLRYLQAPALYESATLGGQGVHGEHTDHTIAPLYMAHNFTPSFSRPLLDVALPLITELPPPPLSINNADDLNALPPMRLPTDILPLDKRTFIPYLPVPYGTHDPWIPPSSLASLAGARHEDALSDDSESDPDAEKVIADEEGYSSGGGYSSNGSQRPLSPGGKSVTFGEGQLTVPKDNQSVASSMVNSQILQKTTQINSKKRKVYKAPTLDTARGLFLPSSLAKKLQNATAAANPHHSHVHFGGNGGDHTGNPNNSIILEQETNDVASRASMLRQAGIETVSEAYQNSAKVFGTVTRTVDTTHGIHTTESGSISGTANNSQLSVPSGGNHSVVSHHQHQQHMLPRGPPLRTPRDATILSMAAYTVSSSHATTHWLSGTTIGAHVSNDQDSTVGNSVNGGISDPRRHLIMSPE